VIYVLLAYLSYPIVFFMRLLSRPERNSVLVFQTAKIGDMICTTPVFREIKKGLPGIKLGVVADPVTVDLLRHNPHVDEIIEFDKSFRGLGGKLRFSAAIYGKGYGNALILLPNSANVLVAFWAMIPRRIAVYPDYAGLTLKLLMCLNTRTEPHAPPRQSLETYLYSLHHLGITVGHEGFNTDKEVYAGPGAKERVLEHLKGEGPFIGLLLGTGNPLKDWGREKFRNLTRMIIDGTSFSIVLLGSEGDSAAGLEVANYIGQTARVINLCGVFTLSELPAVVERLSAVIGVGTGLVYMAEHVRPEAHRGQGRNNTEKGARLRSLLAYVQDTLRVRRDPQEVRQGRIRRRGL
jgi:ADP-heptose:LPS heptosyltransferase